jgi:hypothetical protein
VNHRFLIASPGPATYIPDTTPPVNRFRRSSSRSLLTNRGFDIVSFFSTYTERGNLGVDANEEATSGLNHEGREYGCDTNGWSAPCERWVRKSGRSKGGACSGAESVGPTRDEEPERQGKTVLYYSNRGPGSLLHHEDELDESERISREHLPCQRRRNFT